MNEGYTMLDDTSFPTRGHTHQNVFPNIPSFQSHHHEYDDQVHQHLDQTSSSDDMDVEDIAKAVVSKVGNYYHYYFITAFILLLYILYQIFTIKHKLFFMINDL